MEPNHFFCRTGHEPALSSVFQPPFFFPYELDLVWLEFLLPLLKFHSAVVAEPKESKHVAAFVYLFYRQKGYIWCT
jgi:hypothetical protein